MSLNVDFQWLAANEFEFRSDSLHSSGSCNPLGSLEFVLNLLPKAILLSIHSFVVRSFHSFFKIHVSECNELEWNANSALRAAIHYSILTSGINPSLLPTSYELNTRTEWALKPYFATSLREG